MNKSVITAVLIGLLAAPTAVGCAGDNGPTGADPPSSTATPAASCPGPARADRRVMIDYVDFVMFGGREYIRTRAALPAAQVGRQVGAVRCQLVGSAASPSYQPREGDAAFLPAGTPLFALRDRPAAAVLAAVFDGAFRLYSADHADGWSKP